MTTMIVEVYDAPRAIDVPNEEAKPAARALTQDTTSEMAALRRGMAAGFEALRKEIATGYAAVRRDLGTDIAALCTDFEALRAEFAVFRWMGATALTILIAMALKLFLAP